MTMNENDKQAEPVECSQCKGLGYYDEGHECDDGTMAGGNYVECEKCNPQHVPGFAIGEIYQSRYPTERYFAPYWNKPLPPVGTKLYTHPAQPVQPGGAQGEPVHFRAVLCSEQHDKALGVVPKVAGFVNKKAAEQFILEQRDFKGWKYNLESLYAEAPAAAINEQLQPYTSEKMKGRFAFQPKHIGGWLVDQQTGRSYEPSFAKEYALAMLDAIAAAEAAKKGGV